MRVVDTSVWIEWLLDTPLGASLKTELPSIDQWIVPTIVQLELAKWLTREKGEPVADRTIALTQTCVVVPLETHVAMVAAEACRQHGLSTADAVIYATAREYDADLLTCDGHFEGLPGVIYVPNKPH